MKKLLVLALLLIAGIAFGQVTIYNRSDAPMEWDPITATETVIDIDGDGQADEDVGGDQIVETIVSLEYEMGRSLDPVADRLNPDVILVQTPLAIYTDDLPADGQVYIYALRVLYTTASGVSRSAWNWSDQNGAATPNPFGFRDSSAPESATGFRRQ